MGRTLLSLWGVKPPQRSVDPQPGPEPSPLVPTVLTTSSELKKEEPSPQEDVIMKDANDLEEQSPKRRKMMVTLVADKDKLRAIKPKVHSFFAKRAAPAERKTSTPPPTTFVRPNRVIEQEAPWPKHHARGERSEAVEPLPRRSISTADIRSNQVAFVEDILSLRELPPIYLPQTRKPSRLVMSPAQITNMLAQSTAAETSHPAVKQLVDELSTQQKPFDIGTFETQLWWTKYSPSSPAVSLVKQAAAETEEWLRIKIRDLKHAKRQEKKSRKRRIDRSEMADFIVDDEEDSESGNTQRLLILHGPAGIGKTSTVYSAAQNLDAFVLECNSTKKRTGKTLAELLDGIGQSHAVHASTTSRDTTNCIVLLDEADILFESEAQSFWSTLEKFIASSKRPVVLTCQDLTTLPNTILDSDISAIVDFRQLNYVDMVDIVWNIAFSEGHILDKKQVARVAILFKGDLRKTLSHLQFWCQMSLGGRRSGLDWFLSTQEARNGLRVFSVDTYVEQPPSPSTLASSPPDLDRAAYTADLLSSLDRAELQYFEEGDPEEELSGFQRPEEFIISEPWRVPARDEIMKLDYFENATHRRINTIRDAVYSLDETDETISLELAPFTRDIARSDLNRLVKMGPIASKRLSRRSWAAMGVDSRQFVHNRDQVLATFFKTPFFKQREPVNDDDFSSQETKHSIVNQSSTNLITSDDETDETGDTQSDR